MSSWRRSQAPDIEGHSARAQFAPAEAPDVEAHGRYRGPVAGAETEAHGVPGKVTFWRMTITRADGGVPIVLEPAGPGADGELIYRAVSGLADVKGRMYKHW